MEYYICSNCSKNVSVEDVQYCYICSPENKKINDNKNRKGI